MTSSVAHHLPPASVGCTLCIGYLLHMGARGTPLPSALEPSKKWQRCGPACMHQQVGPGLAHPPTSAKHSNANASNQSRVLVWCRADTTQRGHAKYSACGWQDTQLDREGAAPRTAAQQRAAFLPFHQYQPIAVHAPSATVPTAACIADAGRQGGTA